MGSLHPKHVSIPQRRWIQRSSRMRAPARIREENGGSWRKVGKGKEAKGKDMQGKRDKADGVKAKEEGDTERGDKGKRER